jgi:hypothetical protein
MGRQITAKLTLVSQNIKTGPMAVSRSSSNTCPSTCPLRGFGCYAEHGHSAIHWRNACDSWKAFCAQVQSIPLGRLCRHNEAGDLPGVGNRINHQQLHQLVVANRGRRGFTYTHKPVIAGTYHLPNSTSARVTERVAQANRVSIAAANANGFTISLSAQTLHEADSLSELGISPVVTVQESGAPDRTRTPAGRLVVKCRHVAEGMQCFDCQLCQHPGRAVIIGFPAHGSRRRLVDAVVRAS